MTGQLQRRQFCRRRRHSRNRIHMTLSNDLLKNSPECLPKLLHTQGPHSAKLSQGRLENSFAQLSHALVHASLYPAQQIVQGQDSTVFDTYENQPSILDYPGLKKKEFPIELKLLQQPRSLMLLEVYKRVQPEETNTRILTQLRLH